MQNDAKKNKTTPLLNAIIDSAGGDLVGRVTTVLKEGGRIVVYGMYVLRAASFSLLFKLSDAYCIVGPSSQK